MTALLKLWQSCSSKPLGTWIFSQLVCWKAPYFSTISPRFEVLETGRAQIRMRKRRGVENHIGTIHAIALCNLAELAAGTMLEASLPPNLRWLPKGMSVEYLAKATSDVVARCVLPPYPADRASDVPVVVEISDRKDIVVCRATITMYVSPRKKG